jgi:hypothetical protein
VEKLTNNKIILILSSDMKIMSGTVFWYFLEYFLFSCDVSSRQIVILSILSWIIEYVLAFTIYEMRIVTKIFVCKSAYHKFISTVNELLRSFVLLLVLDIHM